MADSNDYGFDNTILIRCISRLISFRPTGNTMGRKCCVTNCRRTYDNKSKEKVFRVPADGNEKKRWLSVIFRDNTPGTRDMVVCERHWPNGYETVIRYGKQRLLNPPLPFPWVKPSLLPTAVSPSKETIRSSEEVRSQLSNTSADDLSQMETGLRCAKCNFVLDERMCEFKDCLP